jgi:hypothetical protein
VPSNGSFDTHLLQAGLARLLAAGQRWRLIPKRGALAFAWIAALSLEVAAAPCLAPGEPVQWRADYCMLQMETDDEIAVSDCMEREGKRGFRNACASNTHFKRGMCALVIQNGTRAGTMEQCVKDPNFKGRTVQRGGVGG